MAGEGEFVKEWKRLFGFKRTRELMSGAAEVEAALGENVEGRPDLGLKAPVFLSWLAALPTSERFLWL